MYNSRSLTPTHKKTQPTKPKHGEIRKSEIENHRKVILLVVYILRIQFTNRYIFIIENIT